MSFETSTHQLATGPEKPKKPEQSQEELRAVLEQKLKSLKPALQDGIKEYEHALKDDSFADDIDEAAGAGEGRRASLQKKLTTLFDRAERLKVKLNVREPLAQTSPELSTTYTHPDGHQETITLDLEATLQEFVSLYQKTNLELPPDFAATARDIWDHHQLDIEQAIEDHGFDQLLIIPATPDLGTLSEQMKMESGYYDWIKSSGTVPTLAGIPVTSQNADKPRLILAHKAQNLTDRPELASSLNTKGQDVNLDQALTLEDYLVFQRKYFEDTGHHLDEVGWTWLATTSGARLVFSYWNPDNHQLNVNAYDLTNRASNLGVRPSRCFF